MAYKRISPQPVVEGGSGASTLTGILTGNGASPFTANAVTQYGTVIAGASNAVSSVAPSATSGVPYISQGASSNPAFGTAVVAGGGTGVTSNTAYAVLCGGTTSTNPVQSIAGVGSSGQVLTSNGAAALPTFQTPASPSLSTTNALVECDFVGPAGLYGGWESSAGITFVSDTDGRFGVTGATTAFSSGPVQTGTYAMVYEIIAKLNITLSGSAKKWILGLTTETNTLSSVQSGIYFRLEAAGTGTEHWFAVTENATVETTTDTGEAWDNAYHSFRIEINAAGTSATFYIDGVSVATNSTNMPATGTNWQWSKLNASTSTDDFLVDYIMAGATIPARY